MEFQTMGENDYEDLDKDSFKDDDLDEDFEADEPEDD
jgi:hypothetical protein